jgi:drug/metabolite transporter (DMT)-like permease
MLGLRLNYNSFVNSNIIVGYISAIVAAVLFGCVSTMGKPILSTVDPLLNYLHDGWTVFYTFCCKDIVKDY